MNPEAIAFIRLLIADSPAVEADRLFTDAEIYTVLTIEVNPKRAAATLLDAIAVNEVLLSKVIRTQDLSTDGSKVADVLRKQARVLRDQADVEDGDNSWAFLVVDMQPKPYPELTEWPNTYPWTV